MALLYFHVPLAPEAKTKTASGELPPDALVVIETQSNSKPNTKPNTKQKLDSPRPAPQNDPPIDPVVYLSLGRWHLLVAQMRRDFQRLAPPRPHKNPPSETAHWVQKLVACPSQTARAQISTKYVFGTQFHRDVWRHLETIPPGKTTTYLAVAAALGLPLSLARAVAGAVAANRLVVLVPCHRVLARDGLLAGFRWGLPMKRELLARERRGSLGEGVKQ